MRDFRKKGKNKIYKTLFFLVLVAFNILIISSLFNLVKKNKEAIVKKREAEESLARLEDRETSILAKIDSINTPLGTEEAIREKFALKKPGEGEVIITEGAAAGAVETQGWFLKFLRKIFN